MGRKKLLRFAELNELENVFEFPSDIKGKWNLEVFKNNNPIVLELGCGAGEYTIGLAKLHPDKNFIGVDIQGERIWYGSKLATNEGLNNVMFLRTSISQLVDYFDANEVSEIWITFADPHPRSGKTRKRLTSLFFLNIYKQVLAKNAFINLKTDSELLYKYTLEVIEEQKLIISQNMPSIYDLPKLSPELQIQTFYERKHLAMGKKIKYLQFKLNSL